MKVNKIEHSRMPTLVCFLLNIKVLLADAAADNNDDDNQMLR